MQCSRCLRDNASDAHTCAVCGARLDEAPRAAAPRDDATSGERRQLTVVISDIVDSTILVERFDPEDMREMIRGYQDVVVAATNRFGGTVAQYLGDGMSVYFGYPHALEDAAYRAVRASLATLEGMEELNARLGSEYGVRLAIRIGVHTGYAVVVEFIGDSGRDLAPVGDTMHIASRLTDRAPVDGVLVSDATFRLVRGFFEAVTIGALPLKGIAQPVLAHRITGPSAARSRFEAAASRGLTPFIGRDPESRALDERWSAAVSGRGGAVLMCGEAGIGKSRLVHELRGRLDGGQSLVGCCTPEARDSAFHAILDLVGQIMDFETVSDPADRRAGLDRALAQVGGAETGAAPLIARLLGLPVGDGEARQELSPEAERRRLIGALGGLLLLPTRTQPTLLVVEDLHWADPSTIALLDDLMPRLDAQPLLLLLSTRPDFQHQWRQPPDTELAVGRLPPDDARQLVRSMPGADTLPAGVVEDLVRITEGVPLFVEEFTRTAFESPVVRLLAGGDAGTTSIADAMPGTLRDLLMTRLDTLGSTKDVAQLAAVLGRTFDAQVLAAVAGTTVAALEPELAKLAAADLVFETGGGRGSYYFKHALLRDAAYDALLRRRRRELHERVARTFERDFPDTALNQPEVIAHHFTEAAQLEDAVTWWERAARRAMASLAGQEAIRQLTRALELLARMPASAASTAREADLRVALCSGLYLTKGTGAPEIGEALARAREVCERANRHSDLHYVLYMLAGFHNLRAEYDDGQRIAGDALVLADLGPAWRGSFPPPIARAAHLGTLSASLLMTGDYARGLKAARGCLEAGMQTEGFEVQLGMAHPAVVGVSHTSLALWFLGFPDQAWETAMRALELVPDDPAYSYSQCFARCYTTHIRLHRGEAQLALAEADALIATAGERGMEFWLVLGQLQRGWALLLANDGAGALTQLSAAFAASQGSESRISTSCWLGVFAAAYWLVGRVDEAIGFVRMALAFVEERNERAWYPELCRLEGLLLLAADPDQRDAAEARFRDALRAARAQGGRSWELRAATTLAAHLRGTPRAGEARQDLVRAYGAFSEGFDAPDLVRARKLLAELGATVPA